ncbi:hypothetical protein HUA78_08005 [Myxococcus sp. CA033]|uniref:hypothetical protein n=1 Tax=Myxococcus sp. CA033 TaxID=2741516 RepID=UPI00157B0400|nr:hypothetical protein [Myxococcus sp. CA033]NTX34377.1 hypothetical protein [Myxococcus sp. CA033]
MRSLRTKTVTLGMVLLGWVVLSGCGQPEEGMAPDTRGDDVGRPMASQEAVGPPSVRAWQVLDTGMIYRGNTRSSRIVRDSAGNVLTLASYWRNGSQRTLELLKLNPLGQEVWRKVFAWPVAQLQPAESDFYSFPDLVVDASDNILMAGHAPETMDLGDGALGKRSFVAKFSPSGTLLWRHALCDELGIRAVAVDSQGAVWLGGQVGLNCNVGGGVRWVLEVPGWQGYIAKFDANGDYVFDRAIGGRGDRVEVMDLKTSSDDGVVVVGWRYVFNRSPERVAFVSKFARNGPHRWFREYPEATGGFYAVAALGDDIVAVGSFSGTMRFKGQDYPGGIWGRGNIAAYSLTGEERWMSLVGAWLKDVSTGPLGIAVLGACDATCPPPEVQFGGTDGVLGLYSPAGSRLWGAGIGPFHGAAWELTYHPTGEVSLTGDADVDTSTTPFSAKQLIQRLRPQ